MVGFLDYFEANYTGGVRLSHEDRWRVLEPYLDDPDVYVSFTSVLKLGLNPKSRYKTPFGIYAYPLDFAVGRFREGEFEVPFAGDRPHVVVFRCLRPERVLVFRPTDRKILDRAGPANIKTECDEAVQLFFRFAHLNFRGEIRAIRGNGSDQPIEDDSAEETARQLSDHLRRSLGSSGSHLIYSLRALNGNRLAGEAMIRDAYRRMVVQGGRFPLEDQVRGLFGRSGQEYAEFREEVLGKDQRVECDSAFAWNATRLMAPNPVKWSGLLTQLGLTGCRDEGTGTIHPNEQTQAVFFRTQDLKVIDVLRNVPGKRKTPSEMGPTGKLWKDAGSGGVGGLASGLDLHDVVERWIGWLGWAARDPLAWGMSTDVLGRVLDIYRLISLLRIHYPAQFDSIKDKARTAVAGVLADETPMEVKKVLEKIHRMTSGSRRSPA